MLIKQKGEARSIRTPPLRKQSERLVSLATAAKFPARTTGTTAGTFFPWPGDVDREITSVQGRAVQGVDRLLRLFRRAHGDEAKPARLTAHAVHHQVGFDDCSVGRKCVLQVVFGGVEGKISNKQFIAQVIWYCPTYAVFTRLFPTIGFQIITETSSLEDFPCRGIDKLSNSCRNMDFSDGIATKIFKIHFMRFSRHSGPKSLCRSLPGAFPWTNQIPETQSVRAATLSAIPRPAIQPVVHAA